MEKRYVSVLLCLTMTSFITCFQPTCPMIRYTGSFDVTNHVKDHALVASSYKNLTTDTIQECFGVCVQDCRCVSYQLYGKQCELLDENRHTVLAVRFKPAPGYVYFELKQEFKKGSACSSQCNNGCCRFTHCQNGGSCVELCDNVTRKFECKCTAGYVGRVCELPPSCNAYSTRSSANVYPVYTSKNTFINVYCDMVSEPGMVWTLLESFALSNNHKYKIKPLSKDFSVNESNFNWADYRLSLSVMQHIQSHATHWRATCNYEKDGLKKTDFIKGSNQVFNILKSQNDACYRVDYVNVRGNTCNGCTVHMRQYSSYHVNVDSVIGSTYQCDLRLDTSTSRRLKYCGYFCYGCVYSCYYDYCENFGYYNLINPKHRCSANQSATTQWWFGAAR